MRRRGKSRQAIRGPNGAAAASRRGTPVRLALAAALLGVTSLAACGNAPSPLRPESPGASEVRDLTYVLIGISAVIFLLVETLLIVSIIRFRRRPEQEARQIYGSRALELLWTAVPIVIVVVIFVLTVRAMDTPQLPGDALPLDATGRNWWWDFQYPQQGFASPNELHVPVERPVEMSLSSADVIHSFWVPQMGGKTDMVPGKTNRQTFTVVTPGVYTGQCGEYCGVQHAHMRFYLVAESAEEFSDWVVRQQQPATEPSTEGARQGRQVFLSQPCAGCHTIRGTDAAGAQGPDLTHVGSRRSLAAGTLDNTPEDMARWIEDPQGVKEGNLMPNLPLTNEQVNQLVEYLAGLE